MRLYLAGPMSGIKAFNYPAFDALAAELRALEVDEELGGAFEVISPAEQDAPELRERVMLSPDGDLRTLDMPKTSWGDFLSKAVKLLVDGHFSAIVVLPGWENSKGARLETYVAFLCNVSIVAYIGGGSFRTFRADHLARAWTGFNTMRLIKGGMTEDVEPSVQSPA